jgi:hypothetical protein
MVEALPTVRAAQEDAGEGSHDAPPDHGQARAWWRSGLGRWAGAARPELRLAFAVGILPTQKVYPADVMLSGPARKVAGRPRKHPVPSVPSVAAAELIEARPDVFRTISWRTWTKGPKAAFAARRIRVADRPIAVAGQHLPGREV